MGRMEFDEDAIQSMAANAADIQRWLLVIALKNPWVVNESRRQDIIRAAERIIESLT